MLFGVVYKVEGRLTYIVRANSEEEAEEMAESRLQDSELGDLEYIDSEIVTLDTVEGANGSDMENDAKANQGEEKPGEFGIKAYGTTQWFSTKTAFKNYLMKWISRTDGAERNRAVNALTNLECGIFFTDTDC